MPDGSCTSRQARFGQRSLVMMASEKVRGVRAELRAGGVDPGEHRLARQLGADDPGRGYDHLVRLDADRVCRGGLLRECGLEPAPAVAHVRVGGVRGHGAQPAEPRLARHHHGRAHAGVGGEARGGDRAGLVTHEHAHVEALGLESRRHARRPEAAGEQRGLELGHVRRALDPARAEEAVAPVRAEPGPSRTAAHSSPSASGRPSMRFRSCTACPAAPFQRLSIAANAIVLSPTTVTCTRQRFVSCTWRV